MSEHLKIYKTYHTFTEMLAVRWLRRRVIQHDSTTGFDSLVEQTVLQQLRMVHRESEVTQEWLDVPTVEEKP